MLEEKKREKQPITEEKAKRLIVASTVGAVLLLSILIMVMVYQLVAIGVRNNRIANYNAKIAEYETLIEQGEKTKEVRSMRWWIEREARELGLIYQGDKDLT